jgi:triosephosphate isomerase (TIM)
MKYLIANWKAQMTFPQIQTWCQDFLKLVNSDPSLLSNLQQNNIEIIICPPFPFLQYIQYQMKSIKSIAVGAQTVSSIEEGKFTGEVTTQSLQGIAQYAIIGHSERRTHFNETEEMISQKIDQCKKYGIQTILCVRNEEDRIYETNILAYEPTNAIGTGKNANSQDVLNMKKILNISSTIPFLYGGSADENNEQEYLQTGEINGFLVGTASLDAKKFYEMAKKLIG